MIEIHDITNSVFTSKTYILSKRGEGKAWVVDIGDVEPIIDYLNVKNLVVEGVLLTHAHFDHIYGLEALTDYYPNCKVYATEYTKLALASDKLNMSRYHGISINYNKDNVVVVREGERMRLFRDESQIEFYETPGHNPGCMTMVIGGFIFTGDAFIPGIGTNTQLPFSDKQLAHDSIERIHKLAEGKVILSGHQIK